MEFNANLYIIKRHEDSDPEFVVGTSFTDVVGEYEHMGFVPGFSIELYADKLFVTHSVFHRIADERTAVEQKTAEGGCDGH